MKLRLFMQISPIIFVAFCLSFAATQAEAQDRPPGQGKHPPAQEKSGAGQRGPRGDSQQYSLEQAISDQAQLHTIAFDGLAFMTGDVGAATFMPPGKVCDFFGFQYMRDIDAAHRGHNPIFLNRVAANILSILTDEQRKVFADLAREQAPGFIELARQRLPLIKAFYRELTRDVPTGSGGLNKASIMHHVGETFAADAELSYRRAQVSAQIACSFTPAQKGSLATMKFGDFNTWPDLDVDPYKLPRGTEKMVNVAYMTYASELFSWYAGSVDADVYFCPERHGTYFGGFYMKDIPAMGKRDYDISTSFTGDAGEQFLNVLSASQRAIVTNIIGSQRQALREIVDVRRAIALELRSFLAGKTPEKNKVVGLGRRYGELDGELSYIYAEAFAAVFRSLSGEQRKALLALRGPEEKSSAQAYIYSEPMRGEVELPDTDYFFFEPDTSAGKRK